jgi:NAD(P)-dependent dehydrogenase (short-subunit alcohol dehydrogenase family)
MDLQQITQMYDFTGKTVVITGGAGMIGGEIACALCGCGANVALLDRDPALAERVIKRVAGGPGRAAIVFADVLQRETLVQADATIAKEFGPIDILINCAGGNKPQATTGPNLSFFDLPVDALRFVFELNLVGTILPCQVFGRGMAERKEGVILNISSMAAYRPLTRVVGYAAAKAGITNFTQWLAVYMAQEHSPRIRVNAIAPGFLLTDQNRYLLTDQATGELTARGKAIMAHTPMGEFQSPDDMLGTVLWLLSPAAAKVTGIVVPVDGGFQAFGGV